MIQNLEQRFDRLESLLLNNKEIFTVNDFSNYSGLSKSAIYKLTAQRKIAFSCPNGKVIFIKRDDANSYLQRNRIPTAEEIKKTAINYVTLNPISKTFAI